MSTTTTNQVSSPYAIYENETKIACIPYEVLRVASQFVSKDELKYLLQGIHLKVNKNQILIGSTDGHRMFYFQFPILRHDVLILQRGLFPYRASFLVEQ